MRTRRLSVALAVLSVPFMAAGAFAVAGAVSTNPAPRVIIPARTSAVSPTVSPAATVHRSASDDPKPHDTSGTMPSPTLDDRPGHEQGHDGANGTPVASNVPTTSDDPANHDQGDDHGVDATTTTTIDGATIDDSGHDTVDVTTTTSPDQRVDDGSGHDQTDGSGDSSGH